MKYALVTGGSRGIGRAVCLKLADQGYNILINYLSNESAANETRNLVEEKGVQASLLRFDVTNRASVREVLGGWYENNPSSEIEVLINNSGIRKDNLMLWMQDSEWDEVVDTSLGGFYNVTKQVLSEMIKGKFGR